MPDLRLCLLALALLANPAPLGHRHLGAEPADTGQPHNLILVLMDDVGVDLVGCYEVEYANHPAPGYANDTPCIDSIGSEGMIFTDCNVNSACSPTRAQLMTGIPASRNGIGKHVSPPGTVDYEVGLSRFYVPLPGVLRSSILGDYYTGIMGKWHLASSEQFPPPAGGTVHPLGTIGNPWFHYWAGPKGNVPDHCNWQKFFASSDGLIHGGDENPGAGEYVRVATTEHTAVNTTRNAISFLESREGIDEPVFLYVAYNLAHGPLDEPVPPIVDVASCVLPGGSVIRGSDRYTFNGDPARETRSLVTILDNEIGRLYCALMEFDAQSTYPTTIVLLGDNGTHSEATVPPFDFTHAKGSPYQGGIHVPLIVTSPAIPPRLKGTRSSALISGTDFLATFAELGGAALPDDPYVLRDSISFVPVLTGISCGERDHLVSERFKHNFYPDRFGRPPVDYPDSVVLTQAIVDRAGFKLIRTTRKIAGNIIEDDELYYLPTDPHEQSDRIGWTTSNRLYHERWVELGGVLDDDYPSWLQ